MKSIIRYIFLLFEDISWNLSCRYNLMLYGPYGLSGVIERMPPRFLVKYLRKYGATIGNECQIEKGLNLHRPGVKKPFENLIVGNDVYIGHKVKIDLTKKVIIHDNVIIGSRCMLWTHASYYIYENSMPVYKEHHGEIEIFKYSLIYSGVIISFGIKVGNNVKIGAGSMVNRSLEDQCFYGGIPAKFIKKIE
jgi:acetyltransferase-like isoleucine patch superfamily enzyme